MWDRFLFPARRDGSECKVRFLTGAVLLIAVRIGGRCPPYKAVRITPATGRLFSRTMVHEESTYRFATPKRGIQTATGQIRSG